MKVIIEVHCCDFCGNEITKYPYDPNGIFPNGHAYVDSTENYQTVVTDDGVKTVFCQGCCGVLHSAIEHNLIVMPDEIREKINYSAGFRKDGDKWIPLSLYNIKKEKGLIND